MRIPMKYVELKQTDPLFIGGVTLKKRIDVTQYKGMQINYDTDLRMLIIEYKDKIAMLDEFVQMHPANPKDIGLKPVVEAKPVTTHVPQPSQVPSVVAATAQVWNPTMTPEGITKNPAQEPVTLRGKKKPISHAALKEMKDEPILK